MRPLVSIILPCYNAEKYLEHSLDSITGQHYQNIEIICIDDGSTDKTLRMLQDYQLADTRIRILRNRQNQGLILTLNRALKEARGEFFARMDADDYCPPDRINSQVEFLLSNPGYDMVGCSHRIFVDDRKGLELTPALATLDESLHIIALVATPFAHGSVMGRRRLIDEGLYYYDPDYPHSEDFELFSRLSSLNVRMANIKRPLYWLRMNPESVSVRFNLAQVESHLRISRRNLRKKLNSTELCDRILKILSNRISEPVTYEDVKQAFTLLRTFSDQQEKEHPARREVTREVRNFLHLHRLNILIQSNKTGFSVNGPRNIGFFLRTLTLLRAGQLPYVISKLGNFFAFRLFNTRKLDLY